MKNVRISASILAIAGLAAMAQTGFAAETVEFNKTHVMRLSAPAGAVVIGNPRIADVSVHSDNTLFVFGRGFGQTDLLILDAAGNTLVHTDINVVEATTQGSVRMIAPGRGNQTFSCSPYCRPAPGFADDPEFKGAYSGEVGGGGGGTAVASGAAAPAPGAPTVNEKMSGGPETANAASESVEGIESLSKY